MPKNRGWFRVYDRMIDSPEILELTDTEFRIIVSLWALASSGGEEDGTIKYKNGALWRRVAPQIDKAIFLQVLERLMQSGLLIGDDGEYKPHDWGRHQYLFNSWLPSNQKDKRKKSSSDNQAIINNNPSVDPHRIDSDTDSDTDTDTEKIKKPKSSSSRPKVMTPVNKFSNLTEVHTKLAEWLKTQILEWKPDAKVPDDIRPWANEMRLMIEQDERTEEQIVYVIDYLVTDTFWRVNVMSAGTLRKQFDRLEAKMRERKL